MATVNFLYRSTRKRAPLTLRLLYRSNNQDFVLASKTKLIIEKDYWVLHYTKSRNALIKSRQPIINKELDNIEKHIIDTFHKEDIKSINKEWLTEQIHLYYNPIQRESEEFSYWINKITSEAHLRDNGKGGVGLSDCRIKAYKRLLVLFEKSIGKSQVKIKDLDKRMFEDFKKWLFEQEYSQTYALKKLSDLKTVCKEAKVNGIETSSDFESIKTRQGKTYEDDMDVITLTLEEIERVEELELKREALINARKWLILACFTGQRGQALTERIDKENFNTYGENLVIKFTQKKGNKQIVIPVLPKVKKIYEEGLPYPVTVQKLNEHFKKLGELAKIDTQIMGRKQEAIIVSGATNKERRGIKKLRPKYEYFSSHIGRRTFATLHNNIIPRTVIMKVTGHSKESTFLSYINQSSDEHLDIFLDFYKNQELKPS